MSQAFDLKLTVTAHLIKYPHFCAVRNAAISILMTPVHCMRKKKRENEMLIKRLAPMFLKLIISGALIFAFISTFFFVCFCSVMLFISALFFNYSSYFVF